MNTITRVLLVLALCASGCDPSTDEPGGTTNVSGVAIDGFLLVLRTDSTQGAIHLVDPATGVRSPTEHAVSGGFLGDAAVAVSPDGQRIAWLTPARTLVIAGVAQADGAPTLDVAHEVEGAQGNIIAWSPDGDRVTDGRAWVDADSGEAHGCVYDQSLPIGGPRPLTPLPGGHRYLCVDGQQVELMEDGALLGTAPANEGLSADGQLVAGSLHVPSMTTRGLPSEAAVDDFYLRTARRLDLPDGRVLAAPSGVHGWFVVEEAAGFVTVYRQEETTALPADGQVYDLADIFTTGVWQDDEAPWVFEDGLKPWFTEGEGRRYTPIGVTAGGAVVFVVTSYVIRGSGDGSNALYEAEVETALVEIAPDGTTRGFRTSEHASHFADVDTTRLLDLGDGGWLVQGKINHREGLSDAPPGGLYGYVRGKAVHYSGVFDWSPDGRWLFGDEAGVGGAPGKRCFRDLNAPGTARCIEQASYGATIGVVGQGLKAAHANDPPILTAISRRAAWPGEQVTVFGAHFGEAGTIMVGDVSVPAADVTSWSEHRVTFTMTDALPQVGRVRVTTAAGTGGEHRAFTLGRTVRIETPFDAASHGVYPIGQGFNLLDLGELPDDLEPILGDALRIAPGQRLPDGRYIVYSEGAPEPTLAPIVVTAGAFERTLLFEVDDFIADPDAWQLVDVQDASDDLPAAFVTLAGDLVERANDLHPRVGDRVTLHAIKPRIAAGGAHEMGQPDFFRHDGDLTWTSSDFTDGPAQYPPWGVRLLTGWIGPDGQWGTPVYDPARRISPPNYFRGVAADGDLMLLTGQDPMGEGGGAYVLSTDGGRTLGEAVVLAADVVQEALQEPIYVDAAAPFFLVFESGYSDPTMRGVHAIDPAGVLTPDVTPVPAHAQLNGGLLGARSPLVATHDGKVLMHFTLTNTLLAVDFDAETPTWSVAPSAADVGTVRGFWHDHATDDIYAVRLDGTIERATVAGGWADWAPFDLGVVLPIATRVQPLALAKVPAPGGGERWIVLARLLDGAPGAAADAPSPLGRSGWLLGPPL